MFQRAICDLRFGTVGINYWSALAYAMMSPPWGGFPGGTLEDPKSGIGWVHNTYMLDRAEKSGFSPKDRAHLRRGLCGSRRIATRER
ncbi:MAG: hypothetical protein U1D30_11575 [Planctomycetota bacterium]